MERMLRHLLLAIVIPESFATSREEGSVASRDLIRLSDVLSREITKS
jgi:hypothetical protein